MVARDVARTNREVHKVKSDRKHLRRGHVRTLLALLTVVGGLALSQAGLNPASASYANSCRKQVLVAFPAANRVAVTVKPVDGCHDVEDFVGNPTVDVPFAGEFVSLSKNGGGYDLPPITDTERVTKADGSTTITNYSWVKGDVISAQACNYPPGGESVSPYCEIGSATAP